MRIFAILFGSPSVLLDRAWLNRRTKIESVAAVAADAMEVAMAASVDYSRLILTVSAREERCFARNLKQAVLRRLSSPIAKGTAWLTVPTHTNCAVIPKLSREVQEALSASREKGNTAEVIQEFQRGAATAHQPHGSVGPFV